jgi:SpoIID/LytB domain protein
MHRSCSFRGLLRLALYAGLLVFLSIHGAQGQGLPAAVRIGLRTKQAEVRMAGLLSMTLDAGGQTVAVDPGKVVLCKVVDGTLTVTGEDGAVLLAGQPTLSATSPPPNQETSDKCAIRLLASETKPERAYRGSLNLSVTADGISVINYVPLEEYLLGVVPLEMSPKFPVEALKAQAIAARTYAARNIGRCGAQGFDLDDTEACQVYGGLTSESSSTTRAVYGTAGMVLTYDGKLVDAVYSSTCGGYSESALQAWGRDVPYLQSVSDFDLDQGTPPAKPADEGAWNTFFKRLRGLYCLQPKYANPEAFRWVKLVTRKELEAGLPGIGTLQNITVLKRGDSGRVSAVRIDGSDGAKTIDRELQVRRSLGGLRSSAFTVDIYRDDDGTPVVFAFWGGGWGHGLGMCQVGAIGRAEAGWTCDKILAHYYTGTAIEKR